MFRCSVCICTYIYILVCNTHIKQLDVLFSCKPIYHIAFFMIAPCMVFALDHIIHLATYITLVYFTTCLHILYAIHCTFYHFCILTDVHIHAMCPHNTCLTCTSHCRSSNSHHCAILSYH